MVSAKPLRLLCALTLGLVLLVVSCAPAAEPTAAPTTAPPATAPAMQPTAAPPTPTPVPAGERARRGGTLIASGNNFGFASWELCCSTYAKMVDDSVLEYIPSNKFVGGDEAIGPRMATEWSVAKDGLSWTFKLQPDMKAAIPAKDGGGFEVVDCDDVAWSIMKIKTGEGLRQTMRGRTLVPVTKAECPDPLTAVVYTKTPYGALPGMLAVSINDVKPKDYWQSRLKDLGTWAVGSGPWKIDTYIAGDIIIAKPNPYYHRKAADGSPYPYLGEVQFRDITFASCGVALRTNRIHICGEGNFSHWTGGDTLYREAPHLKFAGPFRAEDNPEWGSKGFLGNNPVFFDTHKQKAPWSNVKMREALSLALDRRTLCTIALENWCQPGGYIFVMGTPWNMPRNEVENYPGYNLNTYEQNVAKARQILTELGYALWPDPKSPVIDAPGYFNSGAYLQVPVLEMFHRAGLNANIYIPENLVSVGQAVAGNFEIISWDQLIANPDANQVCYEHYYTGSDRNYGRYSNAQGDDLCNKMGQELDRTKRIALAHQFHKFILDDHARATIAMRGGAQAYSPDLRGVEITSNGGNSVGRMEKWWLAK